MPEKTPKRKKAKFKVGEVVFFNPDVAYDKISERRIFAGQGFMYKPYRATFDSWDGVETWYYERELRPLTKRERG